MTFWDAVHLLVEGLTAGWWVLVLIVIAAAIVWFVDKHWGRSCTHYDVGSADLSQAFRRRKELDQETKKRGKRTSWLRRGKKE